MKATNKSTGQAMLGGPFSLVECKSKKTFTDSDLKGYWNVLYFGFTFCPDICPEELVKVTAAVKEADARLKEKSGESVRPVFISIDPERDGPDEVKAYVEEFDERMVGLTGSKEAVAEAARAYRVYYHKTDESTDYLVDHSII